MTNDELCSRLFPIMSGVQYSKTQSAQFNDSEWSQLNDFVGTLSETGIIIDDDASVSISDIRARARKVKQRHGLDLIIVDYMGLVDAPGRSPTEVIENVSKGLKRLAKAMKCPVIALSQLSRKCEERDNKRPILSDLRQSGSIEQDADMVAFIYRDEVYNPNSQDMGIAEFIIGKLRHGEIGTIPLGTDFSRCRFTHSLREVSKSDAHVKRKRGMDF
jgi:replicative DNA helicase